MLQLENNLAIPIILYLVWKLGGERKGRPKKREENKGEGGEWRVKPLVPLSLFGCLIKIENPPKGSKLEEYKKASVGRCWRLLEVSLKSKIRERLNNNLHFPLLTLLYPLSNHSISDLF